jgi:DNA-binding NarL/FixJ family response regulator
MTAPVRVLLVDDQELFRRGVGIVLDAQDGIEVVGQASNGEEALTKVLELAPDLVLLDLQMPVMDGVEVVARLFSDEWPAPPPRVLVLTTFAIDAAAAEAIRLGASGFLLKDVSPEFLTASIAHAIEGRSVIARTELAQLLRLRHPTPTPAPAPTRRGDETNALKPLSDRERSVFRLLAKGMSNSEIAAAEFISQSTVKTHVGQILAKLQLRDRVQVVVFAHDHGLLDRGAGTSD